MNNDRAGPDRFHLSGRSGFSLRQSDPHAPTANGWIDSGLAEKPCALLAYLHWRDEPVLLTELAQLLWSGIEPVRADGLMSQAFFRIRGALGSSSLELLSSWAQHAQAIRLTMELDSDIPRSRTPTLMHEQEPGAGAGAGPMFGHSQVIRSAAFDRWCALVREQMGMSGIVAMGPRSSGEDQAFEAAIPPVETSVGSADDASMARWVDELWRASMQGTPLSAWLTRPNDSDLRRVIRDICARSVELGGRLAHVQGKGARYVPHALELDLVEVLRYLPGTAGILRDLCDAIERSGSSSPNSSMLLRASIIDVVAAAAEDAPLLLILEDVERYSVAALRDLIARLTLQVECPVLLVTVSASGSQPLTKLSFVYSTEGSGWGAPLVS